MKLIVKNNAGNTISIQIKSNETFKDLKERVEEEAGISLDLKDIALKGKKIRESQRVMEYFLSYGEADEDPLLNVYCAVPGCNNTKMSTPDKVYFEFPTDQIRCHQWVLYCQRLCSVPGKQRLRLTTESTICSDHFRPDQFVKNTRTLLKRTAVPCVTMKLPSLEPTPVAIKEERLSPNLYELNPKNFFNEESEEPLDTNEDVNLELRFCRLCSEACEDYIMIFDDVGKKLKIAEKMNLCLPIEVEITDGLPKQICRPCLEQLNSLFDLADMCSLAQEKLLFINESSSSNEDADIVTFDDAGEDNVFGSVIESPDHEDSHRNNCCPLCKEGIMKKKKTMGTPSKLTSATVGNNMENNSMNDNDSSLGNDFTDSGSKKQSCSQMIADPSDLEVDGSGEFGKINYSLKIDENSVKSESDSLNECYSAFSTNDSSIEDNSRALKSQLSPICEESEPESEFNGTLYNDPENSSSQPLEGNVRTSNCRICALEFHSHEDLFNHSYSHSFKGFYQCAACVVVFSTKQDIMNHFSNHDVEDNVIYCVVCSKFFKSAVSLASHGCKQDEANTKCPLCKKIFRNEETFKQHLKLFHKEITSAFCELCNKVFPDELKLHKHNMYIHAKQKSHCCEECGKVFKSEASMKYHLKSHKSEDSYTCERCGNRFARKSMLINHMTTAHKDSVSETPCFTCKLCYEAFPSTAAAVSHMDNHHKLECMDDSTYSFEMHSVGKLFICEFCERYYAEGTVLYQHRELHAPENPFECKHCNTSFSTNNDALEHRADHLSEEIPTEYLTEFTIPGRYLCEFCERCFLNKTKYEEHLTVHFGPVPYQCRNCSLKFSSLVDAVEHRAKHGDSSPQFEDYDVYRPYECHFCSKTFAIEDALIKHIRMHTGEKPFICDQCGKGFSQSSGLYTHQKVHSNERPYSCTVCPRTFKIKGDRDVHVRKHSGERPYKCEFCGKAFMTQHVYSQHRKIHTGERPYKCDVCGIAFRRSHVLTVHKRIHTGEKPNICDVCGKRYRQKGDMLKHRRLQHGLASNNKPLTDLLL